MVQKWPNRKLEEVCAFQNGLWTGKRPPFVTAKVIRNTNFKNNDGTLNFGDVAEIEVEKKQLKNRLLEKGDLILERSGGGPTQPVGRVVYFDAGGKFSFSNFTTRIRVRNSKELDSVYLWRYLNLLYLSGVTEKMQKQTTGIRNLNFSEYKNLEIPLPPIAEQRKIVARLEGLLGKIKEAKRLRVEAQSAAQNLLPAELHEIFEEGKKKDWEEKELGEVLDYEQPTRYIVNSADYSNEYKTPVLTAGKSFIRGYTDERDNIFPNQKLPVIIFDDFTTATKFVDFPFKVKSSAMKILHAKKWKADIKFLFYMIQTVKLNHDTHKRYWISEYSKIKIPLPPVAEQKKIVARLDSLSEKIRRLQEYQKSTASDFVSLEQSILSKSLSG